jgi:hypothetical protein
MSYVIAFLIACAALALAVIGRFVFVPGIPWNGIDWFGMSAVGLTLLLCVAVLGNAFRSPR